MNPEVLVGIIVSIFASTGFWTLINNVYLNKSKSKTAERKALLGLLHEQLTEKCEMYLKEKWISLQDYEDLRKYIYEPYRELGGNGTGEDLFKKVGNLPNEKAS